MPITKSAKKALRQSKKRRLNNLTYKKKVKNLLKKVEKLASEGKAKEIKELLPEIYKSLDKASKVGVLKENTTNRKKSRVTRLSVKSEK